MLSWREAKAKVNPDPAWNPKPGSDDWKQVAALWGVANARLSYDSTAVPHPEFEKPECVVVPPIQPLPGRKYARNTFVVGAPKKKLTRNEWLADHANAAAFQKALVNMHKIPAPNRTNATLGGTEKGTA